MMDYFCDLMRRTIKYQAEIMTPIQVPQWAGENKVAMRLPQVHLRDFSVGECNVPLLINAPQASNHSSVASYGKDQSVALAALKHIPEVYATDWQSCTHDYRNGTVDTMVEALFKIVHSIGKPVTLLGQCEGGRTAAILAARHPECVANLILAGSPMDTDVGDATITRYAKTLPLSFFQGLVDSGGGRLDGRWILMGFKFVDIWKYHCNDYIDMWMHVDDQAFLDRAHKFHGWNETRQRIPGAFYMQVVDFFRRNSLRDYVDWSKINCPVWLIGGVTDSITPAEQVFNFRKWVSSLKVFRVLASGGHMGVLTGHKNLAEVYEPIFQRLN